MQDNNKPNSATPKKDVHRIIQSAIRTNGKFLYLCKVIPHKPLSIQISESECVTDKEGYNYHFCGTVKFKLADEGFIESNHYQFEGYALVEKEQVTNLSDILCTKEIPF